MSWKAKSALTPRMERWNISEAISNTPTHCQLSQRLDLIDTINNDSIGSEEVTGPTGGQVGKAFYEEKIRESQLSWLSQFQA